MSITKELIVSVAQVTPKAGTNAGKTMFLINGKHWSKIEPSNSQTHVCLEAVADKKDATKTYINVVGFSNDTRMSINEKIDLLKANDPSLAMAIAHLLKLLGLGGNELDCP